MKSRVLVTGATGFIGGHLVKRLKKEHYYVIGLGRKTNTSIENICDEYYSIDLTKKSSSFEVDICIHVAGLANDKSSLSELYAANIIGTENIINSLISCKTFIYISSSSVYNNSNILHTEEETIDITKLLPYGKSKRGGELKVIENQDKFKKISIFRPRAVYGKGDNILLPRILKLVNKKCTFLPAKNLVATSLTAIENLVHGIFLAINNEKEGVHIYNISDEEQYNLNEVIKKIGTKYYNNSRYIYIYNVIRWVSFFLKSNQLAHQYLSYNCILDIGNIKEALKYSSITNFDNVFNSKELKF